MTAKRDFISLLSWTPSEWEGLLERARVFKHDPACARGVLDGKAVGLIFEKPSNRTRVSFDIAIWRMGGHPLYLSSNEIQLGARETVDDAARTLERYLDGLVLRVFAHETVEQTAAAARCPVINGLSDRFHPCQAVADLLTIKEHFGGTAGLILAYVGDGNNVCHSLALACALGGVHMRIATPPDYRPDPDIIAEARKKAEQTGADIQWSDDPRRAVAGAHIVYTDVWASMGQEDEAEARSRVFEPYRVDETLIALAAEPAIFMHCLPAHRGEEVTDVVIDGERSVVFEQAENRLYGQQAVLEWVFAAA